MGGGESAPNVMTKSDAQNRQEKQALLASDPKIRSLLSDYGMGKISIQDAISAGRGLSASPDKAAWKGERMGSALESRKASWKDKAQFDKEFGKNYRTGQEGSYQYGLKDPKDPRSQKYTEADYVNAYRDWADKRFSGEADAELEGQFSAQSNANPYTGAESAMWDLLTTDPATAQRYNTDKIMSDPVLGKTYGQGGYQDRLFADETALQGVNNENEAAMKGHLGQYGGLMNEWSGMQGDWGGYQNKWNTLQNEAADQNNYRLNDTDRTAYGQAAGDIARLSGAEENDLMTNLAGRGLASAGSGAAGAMFSGIKGNKFEQLAKAQTDIAQKRYSSALDTFNTRANLLQGEGSALQGKTGALQGKTGLYGQQGNLLLGKGQQDLNRLNSARGSISNTQNQYQAALQDMFNRNMQGRQQNQSDLAQAAQQSFQFQQALQNQYNTAFTQQQATAGPSFTDIAMGGLGMGVSSLTGGLGTGIAANLTNQTLNPQKNEYKQGQGPQLSYQNK